MTSKPPPPQPLGALWEFCPAGAFLAPPLEFQFMAQELLGVRAWGRGSAPTTPPRPRTATLATPVILRSLLLHPPVGPPGIPPRALGSHAFSCSHWWLGQEPCSSPAPHPGTASPLATESQSQSSRTHCLTLSLQSTQTTAGRPWGPFRSPLLFWLCSGHWRARQLLWLLGRPSHPSPAVGPAGHRAPCASGTGRHIPCSITSSPRSPHPESAPFYYIHKITPHPLRQAPPPEVAETATPKCHQLMPYRPS